MSSSNNSWNSCSSCCFCGCKRAWARTTNHKFRDLSGINFRKLDEFSQGRKFLEDWFGDVALSCIGRSKPRSRTQSVRACVVGTHISIFFYFFLKSSSRTNLLRGPFRGPFSLNILLDFVLRRPLGHQWCPNPCVQTRNGPKVLPKLPWSRNTPRSHTEGPQQNQKVTSKAQNFDELAWTNLMGRVFLKWSAFGILWNFNV